VDNGSTDGTVEWLRVHVRPFFRRYRIIRSSVNKGVFWANNQIWKSAEEEVICIIHNDLFLCERDWDKRVLAAFNREEKLGVAGFGGGCGIAKNGGRFDFCSNMLEAELHGKRVTGDVWVAVLDGMALACRKSMLNKLNGFDEAYPGHHYYDKDVSMGSLEMGYQNMMIGLRCHHQSGMTACTPEYLKWAAERMGTTVANGDQAMHDAAHARFINKWGHRLPVSF
jgi:glycosyltransferase involved in cell wall biosynthesis